MTPVHDSVHVPFAKFEQGEQRSSETSVSCCELRVASSRVPSPLGISCRTHVVPEMGADRVTIRPVDCTQGWIGTCPLFFHLVMVFFIFFLILLDRFCPLRFRLSFLLSLPRRLLCLALLRFLLLPLLFQLLFFCQLRCRPRSTQNI